MTTSLIIVDDFLGNAHEVREGALKLDYTQPEEKTYFPGRNSTQRVNIEGMEQEVSRLVRERLTPTPGSGHGKFRVALADDKGTAGVHIDESHWSGLLYLSLPEDCSGGTDFLRHIPTNTNHAPSSDAELAAMGFTSYREVWDKILWPDTNDQSKWETTMSVPMRFNRLVLLRPWLWHNAGPGFGNNIANGRLIYLMFFDSQGAI